MRRSRLVIALIAGALLALCGCTSIKSAIHEFTPEVSVGVYKDGGSGVTIGVKLGGAEQATPTKTEETKKEETK